MRRLITYAVLTWFNIVALSFMLNAHQTKPDFKKVDVEIVKPALVQLEAKEVTSHDFDRCTCRDEGGGFCCCEPDTCKCGCVCKEKVIVIKK